MIEETRHASAEAEVAQGSAFREKKAWDESAAAFRRATVLDPALAEGFYGLGYALQVGLEDFDGAIAAYRQALVADPLYAKVHNNLGNLLKDKGDVDGAQAGYLKAIEIDPHYAMPHSNLGGLLKNKGDVDGAHAEYLKAIEIDPRLANAHVGLAILLGWERGDWAGAEKEFLRVLEIDPAHAQAKQLLPVVRKNMLVPRPCCLQPSRPGSLALEEDMFGILTVDALGGQAGIDARDIEQLRDAGGVHTVATVRSARALRPPPHRAVRLAPPCGC